MLRCVFVRRFAAAQNEWLISGVEPHSGLIDLLKAGNTVASACCIVLLFRYYYIVALLSSLSNHLDYGLPIADVTARALLTQGALWIEILLCGLHLPPSVTFDFWVDSLGNIIVYRGETIACLGHTLRFYLLWRGVRDW